LGIDTIIYDWDGVFVDPKDLFWKSYNHLYDVGMSRLHFERREDFLDFFDTDWKNNLAKMGLDTEAAQEESITEYRRYFMANRKLLVYNKEMGDAFLRLKSFGFKQGIASNISNLDIIYEPLVKYGLHFDAVVNVDMAKKMKPDPTSILQCMDMMDVGASNCAYVGDSINDMKAGLAACVSLNIGIEWGIERPDNLVLAGADVIAKNPKQLVEIVMDKR